MFSQALRQDVADVRIWMDGKNDDDIFPAEDCKQRLNDVENTRPKILAAMTGNENDAAISVPGSEAVPTGCKIWILIDDRSCDQQSVDYRISGDVDALLGHILRPEHLRGLVRGREVQICDRSHNLSI